MPLREAGLYAHKFFAADCARRNVRHQPNTLGNKYEQQQASEDLWSSDAFAAEEFRHERTDCFTMFGRAAKISSLVAFAKPISARDRHRLGHQQRKFPAGVGLKPAFSAVGVSILRTAWPARWLASGNLRCHLLCTSLRSPGRTHSTVFLAASPIITTVGLSYYGVFAAGNRDRSDDLHVPARTPSFRRLRASSLECFRQEFLGWCAVGFTGNLRPAAHNARRGCFLFRRTCSARPSHSEVRGVLGRDVPDRWVQGGISFPWL